MAKVLMGVLAEDASGWREGCKRASARCAKLGRNYMRG